MKYKSPLVMVGVLSIALFAIASTAFANSALESRLVALVNSGQYDAARSALAAEPHDPTEGLLLEGRIAKSQGNLTVALAHLEAAVRARPRDLRIRREFAHTLFLAKQFGKAHNQFRTLLDQDADPDFRASYARFLTTTDRLKPFRSHFSFSLEPSTNVNRGTTTEEFETGLGILTVDPDTRAQSGVGATARFGGEYRLAFAPGKAFIVGGTAMRTQFPDVSGLDTTRAVVALSYVVETPSRQISFTPFLTREWREDSNSLKATGVSFGARQVVRPDLSVSGSFVHEWRDYPDASHRDGTFSSATIKGVYRLQPDVDISASFTWETNKPQLETQRYRGQIAEVSLTKVFKVGVISSLTLTSGRREFEGLVPFATEHRQDSFYQLSLGAKSPQWHFKGFSPDIRCSFENYDSNVPIFDQSTKGCGFTLTRAF